MGGVKIMKKLLVMSCLVLSTSSIYAVPNFWNSSLRQDEYKINISTEDKNSLHAGCTLRLDRPSESQYLHVIYKGKKIVNTRDKRPLSFLLNDEKALYPTTEVITFTDSLAWNELVESLPNAKKIEIYDNNRFLFTLKPRNGKNEISEITECTL